MNNGEYTQALGFYNQAIELINDSTSHSTTFAYAGVCAQEAGDNNMAKQYFIQAIERGLVETMIFDALGNIAKQEKDVDTQIMAYKTGAERSPADKERYLLKLCYIYKKQKDSDNLLACAIEILNNNSSHLKAMEYKGTALQYKKDMAGAKTTFEEIYDIDSTNINANIFLGNYHYQVGKQKLESSRKKYDKIANPTRVEWHNHNEKSKETMSTYYRPAIKHLEYVYVRKPNSSIKKMLFAMHTKLGENKKAAEYKPE